MAKKVNSPNGKNGGEKHSAVQEDLHTKLLIEFESTENAEVQKEFSVPTPFGKKKTRVADLAVFGWLKGLHLRQVIQVGKTDSNGNPVKREQEAIQDIEQHYEVKVTFVDYEKYVK